MTNRQRLDLWNEINRYAQACGGDTSNKTAYGNIPRQAAVTRIEAIIREIEAGWADDLRRVAEGELPASAADREKE